jgi:hypothetical protein
MKLRQLGTENILIFCMYRKFDSLCLIWHNTTLGFNKQWFKIEVKFHGLVNQFARSGMELLQRNW